MLDNLTEEDIKFLKELSYKLNTQTNDGNADPVFWGIRDYKIYQNEIDGQYLALYEADDDTVLYEEHLNNIEHLKNLLIEEYPNLKLSLEHLDCIDGIIDLLEDEGIEIEISHYDLWPCISDQTGAFLTKEAAQEHLNKNHYHYSKDAHTYAMTAWRNPEFEQLINIIRKLN